MTSAALATAVLDAVQSVAAGGETSGISRLPDVAVVRRERGRRDRGHYSSSIVLRLASGAGISSPAFADRVAVRLRGVPMVARVRVAGGGFLNIWLTQEALGGIAGTVLAAGEEYGQSGFGAGIDLAVLSEAWRGYAELQGANRDDCVSMMCLGAARYWLSRLVSAVGNENGVPGERWSLDDEGMTRQVPENPYFSVCHAAARASATSRYAAAVGMSLGESYDAGLLNGECETELSMALGDFPQSVAVAAKLRQPYRLTRYLESLAMAYHHFCDECRVIPQGDEPVTEVMRSRLWLNAAARVVVVNGLGLLGVNAPERI